MFIFIVEVVTSKVTDVLQFAIDYISQEITSKKKIKKIALENIFFLVD